jgi:hypothetical protein
VGLGAAGVRSGAASCLATLLWTSSLTLQLVRLGHERPADLATLGGPSVTGVAQWAAHALRSASAVWVAWLAALEGLRVPEEPL